MIGHVKWFNAKNGFGFIRGYKTKDEIFVHATDVIIKDSWRNLGTGQPVSYSLQNVKGKTRAAEVKPLSIDDIKAMSVDSDLNLKNKPEQCFNPALKAALTE